MSRMSFPFPTARRGRRYRTSSGRPPFGVGGRNTGQSAGQSRSSGFKMRLLIALGIAIFALISYFGNPSDLNKITGAKERVALHEEEDEIALGLQAAPQMAQQHGGLSRNANDRRAVALMGQKLLDGLNSYIRQRSEETGMPLENPYEFDFHLLADRKTVNAFALPGGQVFITDALYQRLETPGQLAGVLGHEIGHVIERHGNKRMAKQKLFSTLAAAAGTAGGDANSARMAQVAAQMISMKYGREDELESDKWGVELCVRAGYDPNAMVGLMRILDEASPGGGPPEMLSTHPKPANRVQYIQELIAAMYPDGVPSGLEP